MISLALLAAMGVFGYVSYGVFQFVRTEYALVVSCACVLGTVFSGMLFWSVLETSMNYWWGW